ncbi:MAG: LexA repressor [Microgenomates bacterium OLB22]|nr:MAG: LexA repressor [Microgenomates bacterium OLB22]
MNIEKTVTKIRAYFRQNKRLPTYQEIADLCGFASKNAAFKLTQKLIDAGYLSKDEKGRLIPLRLFAPLPNMGIVKAGFPTPAEEELDSVMSLDEYLVDHPEATFMLKVSGDSMIEAGIQPGDTVLIEKGKKPKDGDIVVACVDSEWTMKYYHLEQGQIVLVPANGRYEKIVPKESLELAGVVVSVVRKYN